MRKTVQMRIKLSNEAGSVWDQMVAKVNLYFHGGPVEHGDLMSWPVLHFEAAGFDGKVAPLGGGPPSQCSIQSDAPEASMPDHQHNAAKQLVPFP